MPQALTRQALTASVLIAFVAITAWLLRQFWRSQIERALTWSGESWALTDIDTGAQVALDDVRIRLDAQHCLLLRCVVAGDRLGAVWVWADAALAPQHWHLLRCALYSCATRQSAGAEQATDRA